VPTVVTLQLKRFFAPARAAAARKGDKYVQFDEELGISRYLSSEDKGATPHVVLKLSGVLVHTGSIASGHYYAYARGEKGQWHCMGGTQVYPLRLGAGRYRVSALPALPRSCRLHARQAWELLVKLRERENTIK
jgi:ubiquitin C-terminal hydrolase